RLRLFRNAPRHRLPSSRAPLPSGRALGVRSLPWQRSKSLGHQGWGAKDVGGLSAKKYVNGALPAVRVGGGGEGGDVDARRALGEPGGDLAAEDGHPARRVGPSAVDDEHATFPAGALFPKELGEAGAARFGGLAVEVEAAVDGEAAAPELADE